MECVTNQISEATGMESVLEWNGDSDELRIQVGVLHGTNNKPCFQTTPRVYLAGMEINLPSHDLIM